ncbi:MAG: FG-GAP-like repeat-containing protein [Verrucomicrobiales bacterium]
MHFITRDAATAAYLLGLIASPSGAFASESVIFTRITEGAIATDRQQSMSVAWSDYDNDGDLDVYFTSTGASVGALYRNEGAGSFARVMDSPIASDVHHGFGSAWADFDNDGDLDLFKSDWEYGPSLLYLNNGGSFSKVAYDSGRRSTGVVWGDYDNDGQLDLFLPGGGVSWGSTKVPGLLYHNDGGGRLRKMPASSVGPIVSTPTSGISGVWSDFNGDCLIDLFVANQSGPNSLFLNAPDHRFVRVTEGSHVEDSGDSTSCALGDYDNDGDIDLFVANGSSYPTRDEGQANFLYRNDGGGAFTRVMESPVATDIGQSLGATWGDYDNDGWLDLFVANGETLNQDNFLYRNNGDGTFTRVLEGSPANDGGYSFGCAWGDYDNDGFLDLIVANGALHAEGQIPPNQPEENFLYHNNGNENGWLRVKCVGTVSNRSGIGAKVRVLATIGGRPIWQMREINSGNGFCGNALDAHFGLGDAERVDVLRVEWPSGTVQEWRRFSFFDAGVASRQLFTVTEPPHIEVVGEGQLRLHGWKGQEFRIEASADLKEWVSLGTVASSDSTAVISITDPNAGSFARRFYRASNRPMPGDWLGAQRIDFHGIEITNTSAMEGCLMESPDRLTLFFPSNGAGGQGGIDIWMARRDGLYYPWQDPVSLPPPINSAFDDFCPTPLADGELFFVSRRPGGCGENSADIYLTRLDANAGWIDPAHLGCDVNSTGDEFSPSYVPADGGTLFFSSNRDGMHKIYASTRQPDSTFGAPVEVTALNFPGFDTLRPNVSEDGLEVVFDSNRPGGLGGPDIWSATRASLASAWSRPVNLGPNVNSDSAETRASLSSDGRRLTFVSTRTGGQGSSDVYVSSR